MKIRVLFLLLVLSGSLFGQTSHKSLCLELFRDLKRSIEDSTDITSERQILIFSGDSDAIAYLNDAMATTLKIETTRDTVLLRLNELSLRLDSDRANSFRNSQYSRKLKLGVSYQFDHRTLEWQASISDKISKEDMDEILNEWFPVDISGDYRQGQPAPLVIMISSLAVLTLGAALFFVRS